MKTITTAASYLYQTIDSELVVNDWRKFWQDWNTVRMNGVYWESVCNGEEAWDMDWQANNPSKSMECRDTVDYIGFHEHGPFTNLKAVNTHPDSVDSARDAEYYRNYYATLSGFTDKGFPEASVEFHWNKADRNFASEWDGNELLEEHEYKDDILKVLNTWHTESDLVCMSDVINDSEKENDKDNWLMHDTYSNGMKPHSEREFTSYDEWVNEQDLTHGVSFNGGVRFANAGYKVENLAHWKGGVFSSAGFKKHCKLSARRRSVDMLGLSKTKTTRLKDIKRKPRNKAKLTKKERDRLFMAQFKTA